MDIKSLLAEKLRDKEYRDAFVASQIKIGLPMQCRALRENRQWTQPRLAEAAQMTQPRISEIERPGERKLNIETLLRLASAFDVALQVRFVPFSELIDDDDAVDYANFSIPKFKEDIARLEEREKSEERAINIAVWKALNPRAEKEEKANEGSEPVKQEEEDCSQNADLGGYKSYASIGSH
jgi:transcriptional regulator with XRE-family HTH domain